MSRVRQFRHAVALLAAMAMALPAGTARADNGLTGAYLAARVAAHGNDFEAAAEYFARALEYDPDNPFLIENALQAEAGLGRVDAAATLAERLQAVGVTSQLGNLVTVTEMARTRAFSALSEAIAGEELSVGPLVDGLVLAWAHLGAGRVSDALEAFDSVGTLPGMHAFGLYHKALALASVGDFESADAILSGEAEGPLRLTRRGVVARIQILSQLERSDDALELIAAVFGSEPEADAALLRAALQTGTPLPFSMVRDPVDGIAEVFYTVAGVLAGEADDNFTLIYTRMTEFLRPGHVDAILMSAQLLERLNQYQLANDTYARVPSDDPFFPAAELGRAEVLYRSGDVEAAFEVLEVLTASHGHLLHVHNTLGDLLRREQRFDEASRAYDRAIELIGEPERQHWVVFYTRAITHEREGRWEQAEADFRRALELEPDQPHVLNYLGYSMVEMRVNLDEALDMIERAVAGEPDNGYITDSLGWVLYRLGRHDEAVHYMERAVELMPTDPIVNDHLGDVYWAVGRKREAEFQWRRALSFGPADDLDMDRIRAKLDVGLDQVLEDEGAEPHHRSDDDGL